MIILRWILCGALVSAFLIFSLFNAWVVCREVVLKREIGLTFAPLMGGLTGLVALFVCPLEGALTFFWVPLIVDLGTVPYLLYCMLTSAQLRRYW